MIPIDLSAINSDILTPALKLLPGKLDSVAARAELLSIGQQESRFLYRAQIGGPAKSFYQFEEGGGVKGVMTHPATAGLCMALCADRGVEFDRHTVYLAMEHDDLLATCMARLLLYADSRPLPPIDDAQAGWDCYVRNWRPGQPHRDTWDAFHAKAVEVLV